MELNDWQKNWDALGKDDPLWVVLTDPSKTDGRWKPEEFFETGREEIRGVLARLGEMGVKPGRERALDFGCGVGRLSQALAEHFDEVHGVDISPSMVGHATRFNRFPDRCHYHINAADGLPLFPADHFDFVYSNITLQHIEPRFGKNYIREFVRVLKPGGIVVFQVLKPVFWRSLVPESAVRTWRRWKHGDKPFIGMFGVAQGEITSLLDHAGAKILRSESFPSDTPRFVSFRYTAVKSAVDSMK
jgi:ubiquinone/menaquinone biosynthesis C-methylase UbiE